MTRRRRRSGARFAAANRLRWALIALCGLAACARILGIKPEGPRPFPHRAHVLKGVPCVTCHPGIQHAGNSDQLHLPGEKICLGCHKKPHNRHACLGCHALPMTRIHAAQAREHLKFSHARHKSSRLGNCARCHIGVGTPGGSLRAPMGVCLGCHHHRDQFSVRDCGGCHKNLRRELATPQNHIVHGPNWLHEHGTRAASATDLCASCHRQSFCAGCHGATVPALPSTLHFDDPLRAGMHRAGFLARHAEEARADPGTCSTCHRQTFCSGCHTRERVAAAANVNGRDPHPPGWVGVPPAPNEHGAAARRDPLSCAGCHSGAGEALCVGCHRVGGIGGNPHPPGWSSTKPMSDLPCRLCHRIAP